MTRDIARSASAHRLDVAMGERIRERRRQIGLSQRELADQLGITFQQVQKYERGANRISFSRLVETAAALQTSLAELAAGLEGPSAVADVTSLNALRTEEGAIEMLELYAALPLEFRRPLIHHAREIAQGLAEKSPRRQRERRLRRRG